MTLQNKSVVPLIQSSSPDEAVKTARALVAGGLDTLEVVLRTDAALDCLEAVAGNLPDANVGAGTILCSAHATAACKRGASFLVSPGIDDGVVTIGKEAGISVIPGVATATEVQRAWNLGLRIVKFFPAGNAGGPGMIKALSSAFRDMKFMPTGGINISNLSTYMSIPSVVACGGSWLTPTEKIVGGDFEAVTALASQAHNISMQYKDDG
ncbi:MAG: bifunctional 4-hydroxy-2-oxoglutarate aldolase/2-dehydro-3-deoxy-phosphogluconate aldolase [Aquisalinus sp.]|nr:bifunctional 4-hydroxy-2-oxoglutarate aldolase/2-dehydro-3-deoxy-phosphogluconate aldolase [Aquisalinus sp.]